MENNKGMGDNNFLKSAALWVVIALIMVILFQLFNTTPAEISKYSYSEFLTLMQQGEIQEVTIQGDTIRGILLQEGAPFETYAPQDPNLVNNLIDNNHRKAR